MPFRDSKMHFRNSEMPFWDSETHCWGPRNARIIGIDLNPEAKRWEKEGFEI